MVEVRNLALLVTVCLVVATAAGLPHVVCGQESPPHLIIIDYSHGQDQNVQGRYYHDPNFFGNLSEMGYEVIIAYGGLNSSILESAKCLILGSIYGEDNGFSEEEFDVIGEWFQEDGRFIWVAYDSDYADDPEGCHFINTNMSTVLERIGSKVYGEDAHIADDILNCGATYRPIANVTSNDPFVAKVVEGVEQVLMHGATLLYGSNSSAPSRNESPVFLETVTIPGVHPILFYSPTAYVEDWNPPPPILYADHQMGSFVAATIQVTAGTTGENVIVVSGGAPYGSYCPMYADEYYDVPLTGSRFVLQLVEFGMSYPPQSLQTIYLVIGGAVVAVVAIALLLLDRRKLQT